MPRYGYRTRQVYPTRQRPGTGLITVATSPLTPINVSCPLPSQMPQCSTMPHCLHLASLPSPRRSPVTAAPDHRSPNPTAVFAATLPRSAPPVRASTHQVSAPACILPTRSLQLSFRDSRFDGVQTLPTHLILQEVTTYVAPPPLTLSVSRFAEFRIIHKYLQGFS